MPNLVNIVHPYSYKCVQRKEGLTLVGGVIKEFRERDENVAKFVRTALDLDIRVFRYDFPPKGTFESAMQNGVVSLCPIYGKLLFDERIIGFDTLDNGKPIIDEKPEEMDEETWNKFKGLFISDSKLKELMGNPKRTFYIGGFFETCVKNMAHHQIKNYTPDKEVFCIEELCASINDEKTQEVRDGLREDGIKLISYEEALRLL